MATASQNHASPTEIRVGNLSMSGTQRGTHVHVTVLGSGEPGSRPLVGNLTMTTAEWASLQTLAIQLAIGDRRAQLDAETRAKLNARLEWLEPLASLVGDWEWSQLLEDGAPYPDSAIEAAVRAFAFVEKSKR